jgi:enediyne core biosynthesis thioesterase
MSRSFYQYDHVVTLDESNALGNVYFVHHLRWQGRCRELFLRDHAPDVLARLGRDLDLVTLRCSCEYLAEAFPFDHIVVKMFVASATQNRLSMRFEYWAESRMIARGEQAVACMRRTTTGLSPVPLPPSLREAVAAFVEPSHEARESGPS